MAEIITAPRATTYNGGDLLPLYDADTGALQGLTPTVLEAVLAQARAEEVLAAQAATALDDAHLFEVYDSTGARFSMTGAALKEALATAGIEDDSGITLAQARALIATWARAGQSEPVGLDSLASPALNDLARYDGSMWVAGPIGGGAIVDRGLDPLDAVRGRSGRPGRAVVGGEESAAEHAGGGRREQVPERAGGLHDSGSGARHGGCGRADRGLGRDREHGSDPLREVDERVRRGLRAPAARTPHDGAHAHHQRLEPDRHGAVARDGRARPGRDDARRVLGRGALRGDEPRWRAAGRGRARRRAGAPVRGVGGGGVGCERGERGEGGERGGAERGGEQGRRVRCVHREGREQRDAGVRGVHGRERRGRGAGLADGECEHPVRHDGRAGGDDGGAEPGGGGRAGADAGRGLGGGGQRRDDPGRADHGVP